MTYQADFICTYKLMEVEDQEQMYRIQLLQAFDLNEWNDDHINSLIMELYKKVSLVTGFNEIFIKARENNEIIEMLGYFNLDEITDDVVFTLLFKFEYFDLIHRCIVDYFVSNTIDSKYINLLLNAL